MKYLTKNQNGVWFVRHEPGRGDTNQGVGCKNSHQEFKIIIHLNHQFYERRIPG